MKRFRVTKHSTVDKSFEITSPDDMEIFIVIDFDDVGHPRVNKEAKAIVKVLNNHLDELQELIGN